MRAQLTQEYIKKFLEYNPKTGVFKRRRKMGSKVSKNAITCVYRCKGIPIIKVGKLGKHSAARVAYVYHYGNPPLTARDEITLRNGNVKDLRACNLTMGKRHSAFVSSKRTKTSSGHRHILKMKPNKNTDILRYKVIVRAQGEAIYVGVYYTIQEAIIARDAAYNGLIKVSG